MDCKELISNMRKYSAFGLPPEECKRVATTIETLLAEREAAAKSVKMLINLGKDAWKLTETCNKLGVDELLGQLTEECGELVQAAQKVRRARKGTTPVSLDDALVKLIEECSDVLLCIDALAEVDLVDLVGMQFVGRYKNDRWYQRTVQREEEDGLQRAD